MRSKSTYPYWFLIPGGVIFFVMFLVPAIASFWFSLTRWDLFDSQFIGLENYQMFLEEPFLLKGMTNTVIFAVVTSLSKSILGLLLAVLLTSGIYAQNYLRVLVFFPVLVSTVGVGITFGEMMHPTEGVINLTLTFFGLEGPGWLTNPSLALYSVALVDIWKGIGLATLIYIAGLATIGTDYYEAASLDGASAVQKFFKITLPLMRPATVTVVNLSLIGGLRSFDIVWAMTRGGPGFSSDVLASVVFKQYQSGFYGLSTAGNVVLFLLVAMIVLPLNIWFKRREVSV